MDKANRALLESQLQDNNHDLFIMTPEEFGELQKQIGLEKLSTVKTLASYTSTALDVKTTVDQVREFRGLERLSKKILGVSDT